MKIPKTILREARNSKWLEGGAWIELNIKHCRRTHELFERVLVNLAAEIELSWKDMYNAKPVREQAFRQLVVAAVLLDNMLAYQFKNPGDRESLLGPKLSEIVRKYNYCLLEKE